MRWYQGAHALARLGHDLELCAATVPQALVRPMGRRSALEEIGAMLQAAAYAKIGTLGQPAVGPYPAWAPLSYFTVKRKGHRMMLLDTGRFKQHVLYEVHVPTTSVAVGTDLDYVVYNELGTSRAPQRAVFGPTVLENWERIEAILARSTMAGFAAAFGFGFSELIPSLTRAEMDAMEDVGERV